jgi:pilus assembly protein Flp/PilA
MLLNLYTKLRALHATRDRGATAVEYGLIVAAIAAIIIITVFFLGGRIEEAFQTTCTNMNNGNACPHN